MDWLGKHLEATYGITVTGLSKPQAWNPHVWRVDRAEGPPWIARAFQTARSGERVAGDAAILRYLESVGFPAERCAADEPVSVHGGEHVLVTTFVDGTEPRDWRAVGERLGWLHSLDAPITRDGGSWHGDPAFEGLPACDVANALAMLDAVAGRIQTHAVDRFESLRATVAALDAGAGLPTALVHPDPGPVNAVASPADGVVFIDWAGSGIGPRIASLALLLCVGDVEAAVTGYREHVPALTDDELARLGAVLRVRPWFWAAYYYAMTVKGGGMPSGGEGWWPNDAALDAIADRAVDALTLRS